MAKSLMKFSYLVNAGYTVIVPELFGQGEQAAGCGERSIAEVVVAAGWRQGLAQVLGVHLWLQSLSLCSTQRMICYR